MEKLLLLMLLLLLLLQLLQPASLEETIRNSTICKTHSCISVAARMTEMMNLEADPCDDFYEFACGNFKNIFNYDPEISAQLSKAYNSPEPMYYITVMKMLTKQMDNILFEMLSLSSTNISKNKELNPLFVLAQQMQRSCQKWILSDNTDDNVFADLLKPLMRKLKSDFSSLTAERLLALIVSSGSGSLISVGFPFQHTWNIILSDDYPYNAVDMKIAKMHKIKKFDFTPYLSMLNASAMELHDVSLQGHESQLEQTRLDLAQAIDEKLPENDCFVEVNDTIDWKFLTVFDSISECLQPNNSFSWLNFINEFVNSSINASVTPVAFEVTQLSNLIKLGNFLKRQPMWSNSSTGRRLSPQMSFLIADWLLSFSSLMPKNLRNRWLHDSYRTFPTHRLPSHQTPSTFIDCVEWTKSLMLPIVEKMFQITHLPNYFDDVSMIIEKVMDATERNIMKSWMNNHTKNAAVKRLQAMKYEIGFHKMNDSDLMLLYADSLREFDEAVTSGGSVSFGEMVSIGLRAEARREILFILRQSKLSMFLTLSSFIANAYYSFDLHTFAFALGWMQSSRYDTEHLDYVRIGSIAQIIGHEINHMFKLNLHQSLRVNNSLEIYSDKTYNDSVRCIEDQMNKEETFPGIPENSTNPLTLLEDIADIIGMSSAFEAWRHMAKSSSGQQKLLPGVLSKMSPDQIVYIRASQVFCFKGEPSAVVMQHNSKSASHRNGRTRVRNMMRNNPQFAKVFQCKAGTPMNPSNKCVFW